MNDNTKNEAPKANLRFSTRLAPKKAVESTEVDLGIPVVSELQTRLPVGLAAGRTYVETA